MPFGPLEDTVLTAEAPSGSSSRFRPYASPNHHVVKSRYITSNDPRGYIPVYEYPLNGQWIMMDIDDGYVLWTGIWKALGNSKADIVKMVESQPDLASQIRRVRGGYLKIQGTWMPYEVALRLSRRVAWDIRHDLVPLFGPTFPATCLSPDQAGYGQVIPNAGGRRRARRSTNGQTSIFVSNGGSGSKPSSWAIVNYHPPSTSPGTDTINQINVSNDLSLPTSGQSLGRARPSAPRHARYAPYLDAPSTAKDSNSPVRSQPAPLSSSPSSSFGDPISLPPLHSPPKNSSTSSSAIALPPISSLADQKPNDSRTVLERLRAEDDDTHCYSPTFTHHRACRGERRMSLDEQMRQRSRALLSSSTRSPFVAPSWSEDRSCVHNSNVYESSSTSGSPFERSPISPVSPVTPPHVHLPPVSSPKVMLSRYEQGSRLLEPRAHAW